ncbi:MAG TPA: PAS domain-containing protein, partial [Actinomycetota bacterium]
MPDRDRSTIRRDLMVVPVAVVLFAVGIVSGAFTAIHEMIASAPPAFAGWTEGALLVATSVGALMAVSQRRRGRVDRRRRADAEARYRTMLEHAPVVVYAWDHMVESGGSTMSYISPQIERLVGFAPERWLEDPALWRNRVHPDDVEDVVSIWNAAVEARSRFAAEYRMRTLNGDEVWIRDEASPSTEGSVTRYRGVMYDVTAERTTRRQVHEAEARYRSLVERLPAITYRSDVHDRVEGDRVNYVSPQIFDVMGFTQQEWSSPGFWESRIHDEDRLEIVAEARRTDRTLEPFDVEYRLVRRDGSIIWVHDSSTVVHRGDGTTVWQGLIQDVTERRHAEMALAEAEERFRRLVEQLPAVVYIDAADEIATAHYLSPQYERLTGYTPQERLETPGLWMDMIHPDDRRRVIAESNRTNETGEDYDVEHRIVRKDGRVVWVHDHAFLVRSTGRDDVWQGVLTDITERKLAEEALSSRDRILEAAGDAAERFLRARSWRDDIDDVLARLGEAGGATRVGVFENVGDDGGTRVRLHHTWLAADAPPTLGRSPSVARRGVAAWEASLERGDVIHGPVSALEPPERQRFEEFGILSIMVMPVFADGVWWGSIGLDDCRSDRVWQPAEIDAIRVVASTLGAAIEREQAARRLTEAEERYRAIVEHVPAAIYLDRPDASMHSVYVSPQIEHIMGVTPQEWIDDPELWLTIIAPEDREQVRRSYKEAISDRRAWRAEYRVNTPDGRAIWVHDEITFITDSEGGPSFLQGVLMDITERKLAEQSLRDSERHEREAAARLRALDDMKNTFLAAVSHELRSPLTSILGLSITLERTPDMADEDRGELLQRLAFNARKLDRLLRDLLDIDRLNRGIVEPQYRTIDVAALIH